MSRIPNELIVQARRADIVAVCRDRGEKLAVDSLYRGKYRIKHEGGLIVWDSHFYWFRNKSNGGYIPNQGSFGRKTRNGADAFNTLTFYICRYCNGDYKQFKSAVEYLSNFHLSRNTNWFLDIDAKPNIKNDIPKPAGDSNAPKVVEYLTEKRFLKLDTVKEFQLRDLFYQDTNKNAVFVCRDENGKINGFELKGTRENKRFFRSSENAIFTFPCGEEQTGLIAFESVIDLMSYYELHQEQLTHHLLVSMGGLKSSVLEQVLAQRNSDFKVCIATDNDEAGNDFFESFKKDHPNYEVSRHKPKNFGEDWNDIVKRINQKV